MTIEEQVRSEHPDWTDEQVAAEVTKREADAKPDPDPKPDERDAAFARLRREKQDADKRAKDAEDKLAAKAREEAEAQGEWQKLAETYEKERDTARKALADLQQQIKVEAVAAGLKFRHADEAIALLPSELDRTDEAAVQKALEQLAEDRPHLIDSGTPGPTGRPPTGGGKGDLTKADVERMTAAEINARWDDVQKVLST
jgi:hypothetical protein